jgi:hypothetical protein
VPPVARGSLEAPVERVEAMVDGMSHDDGLRTWVEDCLANLDKVLKWFQMADLALNWEKCHFMVENKLSLGIKF